MPIAAKSPCRHVGCRALVDRAGYCEQHRRESHKRYHAGSVNHQINNRFYASARWRRVRAQQLQQEPLCRHCRKSGRLTEATHVDHIIERSRGGDDYVDNNLQSLCKSCHEAKSRRDQAGAGRISTD